MTASINAEGVIFDDSDGDLRRGEGSSWQKLVTFIQSEPLILAVMAGSFLARFLLADWNSYWLDELLSVNVYGHWYDTVSEAIRHLAERSVHPPLYQFILYNWISVFGDAEVATRTLSNLFICGATLYLYLGIRQFFPRGIALMSAITFALMNVPTYYGLETRSYAQTIFLATLSSYLLLRVVKVGIESTWGSSVLSVRGVFFVLTNSALLLTHYYNLFFLIAQGLVALVFLMTKRPARSWLSSLGSLGLLYVLPVAIFGIVWGSVFVDTLGRNAGDFSLEEGAVLESPTGILRTLITANIDPPLWVTVIGFALLVALLGRSMLQAFRRSQAESESMRSWTVIYLMSWLVLPQLVVYAVFSIVGVARYSLRYFLFSIPPMAALVVLLVVELGHVVRRRFMRFERSSVVSRGVIFVWLAVLITLIMPGALEAATTHKHDWRGIVQRVVDVVNTDETGTYVIFETSHRREPMADYYFARFSKDIRVFDTVQRVEESRGEYRILSVDEPVIAEYDHLILLFTHSRTMHFPKLLEALGSRYEVRHRQLDRLGRGFIVYDVHPSS